MRWIDIVCALLLTAWFAAPAAAWVDPTTGLDHASRVTRPADIPERNWLPGHRGVDLGLEHGAKVRAAADGVVVFAGVVVGVPTVSIEHAGGVRTTYQPVRANISKGDTVREGQVIGTLVRGREHDGLHWGALVAKDTYIDPLTLLNTPVIRLKPI